jgi:hypothetical protein
MIKGELAKTLKEEKFDGRHNKGISDRAPDRGDVQSLEERERPGSLKSPAQAKVGEAGPEPDEPDEAVKKGDGFYPGRYRYSTDDYTIYKNLKTPH